MSLIYVKNTKRRNKTKRQKRSFCSLIHLDVSVISILHQTDMRHVSHKTLTDRWALTHHHSYLNNSTYVLGKVLLEPSLPSSLIISTYIQQITVLGEKHLLVWL